MELTATERQLMELLQERDTQEKRDAQQRTMRFLTGVAERTGVPVHALAIDPQTGTVVDTREAGLGRAAAIAEELDRAARAREDRADANGYAAGESVPDRAPTHDEAPVER